MRKIHYTLQSEHHLRHFARLQFGLFLQGIGMSLESALDYFRQGFSKNYSTEQVLFVFIFFINITKFIFNSFFYYSLIKNIHIILGIFMVKKVNDK